MYELSNALHRPAASLERIPFFIRSGLSFVISRTLTAIAWGMSMHYSERSSRGHRMGFPKLAAIMIPMFADFLLNSGNLQESPHGHEMQHSRL